MKICLECEVESKIKLEEAIMEFDDKRYVFSPNEDGYLAKISITATAPKPERCTSGFKDEGKTIFFNTDSEFNETLIKEFQYFEGILSLIGNLKRIRWQSAWIEYIPETEEEKEQAKLTKFRWEKKLPDDDVEVPAKSLAQMVLRKDTHDLLNVYLSFYREGLNEYKSFRFINAFFNFYFILEGVYGNNEWRNFEVREAFKNSPDFSVFLQEVIDNDISKSKEMQDDVSAMLNSLKDRYGNPLNKSMDIDGLTHLIVDTRGTLHHYSDDPNRQQNTPFNHESFQSITTVMLILSDKTLRRMIKEIDDYMKGPDGLSGTVVR